MAKDRPPGRFGAPSAPPGERFSDAGPPAGHPEDEETIL